jgi:hypothetical protein
MIHYDFGIGSEGKAHVWSRLDLNEAVCGSSIVFHFTYDELEGIVKCRACRSKTSLPTSIIAIEARMGQGATLAAVSLAIEEQKITNRPIVSNMVFKIKKFKPLTSKNISKISNSIIVIYNADFFLGPRNSNDQAVIKLLSLSRIKSNKIILTTHSFSNLDNRIRNSLTEIIRVTKIAQNTFRFRGVDLRTNRALVGKILGQFYYDYYNTSEIVRKVL